MRTIRTVNAILVFTALQALFALTPAEIGAQAETVNVVLSADYFLYDLKADCTGVSFNFPEQYIEWSMIQGTRIASGRTPILRATNGPSIPDPRRPFQSCPPFAIGVGADTWRPVENVSLAGTFDSNSNERIVVTIEMFDDDGGLLDDDDQLDLTPLGGSAVVFFIDPKTHRWTVPNVRDAFCNTPVAGCSDNEGQWCGACNDAQTCCNNGDFNSFRGYSFRGDGNGAGLSWTVSLTRFDCGARRDVDTDGDTLLDDWEIHGYDHGCDGTIDLPFNLWGANPMHKDIYIEYDACAGLRISRQSVQNLKAVFANAPIDAGGKPNPDGRPGINVWVDAGNLVDRFAHEGMNTCHDQKHNDSDGKMDMADPDCQRGWEEAAGPCNDGIDNDNDGNKDSGGTCSGVDANGAVIAQIEGIRGNCADGISNKDGDELVDGADTECRVGDTFFGNLGEGKEVTCVPWGVPDINETYLSIKAGNFKAARHGKFRYALRWPKSGRQSIEDGVVGACGNGIDDGGNGLADGADPVCQLAREDGVHVIGGPGDCHDHLDNDGDGNGDFMDPECVQLPEYPSTGTFSCYDSKDNGDDLIDGDDPDCKVWGGYADGDNMVIFDDDDSSVVLTHELGHTLGLGHGGPESAGPPSTINFKPNYLSLMNYLYAGGVPQDPDAMVEDITKLSENGMGAGNCGDRIDNDGDGFIDALDPNCRGTCFDGIDNDGDGGIDQLDPQCRGIDLEGDGIGDHLQLDFSPQSMHAGSPRSILSDNLHENFQREADAFGVNLDFNDDGHQDAWGDALNMVRFRRYLPTMNEGPGAPANSCSDGIDNDGNGATDHFDSGSCRAPLGAVSFAAYLTVPRTGERMPVPVGGTVLLTRLPVGFDWNNDNDVNDFLAIDMDEDEDPSNDTDDDPQLLMDFDDWKNIRLAPVVMNVPRQGAPSRDREPSVPELVDFVEKSRPADLVLESSSTRVVPSASGAITLAVVVENIAPSEAYGPVTLTLSGLPTGATVTASGGQCWPQNGETICVRNRMKGYEVWTLSFTLQSELCSWRSNAIGLRVQHAGGFELNPEDNALAIPVGGSGIWSQWRQCPSHWGASAFTGPSALGTPTVVYSGAAISNTPVIDDAGDIYFADTSGRVRKIAPSGTSRWTTPSLGVVRAGPALTPMGTIVVATEDGRIRGLSQATGGQLWSYAVPTNVLSSLVVAGDRLYAVTQFGLGLADSVFAFDVDGNFLWSRQLSGPIVAAPTVGANGTIFVSVASGLFFSPAALTAVSTSGTVLWSKTLDGDARDTPVQRNGRVYVGTSTRRVYAFDAVTGTQAWMYTTPCLTLEACEISGAPVALPSNQLAVGSAGGRVHVIRDAGTSATLVRSIAASGLFLGGPRDSMVVGQNNLAYVGNKNSQLRLLNLTTGAQISLASMQGNAVGAVALDGQGRLYVGTDRGFLYRY